MRISLEILTHVRPTRWNQTHQRPPGSTRRSWAPFKHRVGRDSSRLGYSSLKNSSGICLVALPGCQRRSFLPLVNFFFSTGRGRHRLRPCICFSLAVYAERTDPAGPPYYQPSRNKPIALAIGGSLLMGMAPEEMEVISKICGALLVNFGTVGDARGMFKVGESWSPLEGQR